MLMGYSSLPIDIEVISNYLIENHFIINEKSRRLLSYFAREDLSYEYKIDRAGHLLKWLWIESSAISSRQNITDLLCYILSSLQSKNKVVEDLIQRTKSQFGVLIQHQWEGMLVCIQQWLEAQSIV